MEQIYELENLILEAEEKLFQLKTNKFKLSNKEKGKYDRKSFMILLTQIKAQEEYIKYLENRKEGLEILYRRRN